MFSLPHYLIDAEKITPGHPFYEPLNDCIDEMNRERLLVKAGDIDIRLSDIPQHEKHRYGFSVKAGSSYRGVTYLDKSFCEDLMPQVLKANLRHCVNNHVFTTCSDNRSRKLMAGLFGVVGIAGLNIATLDKVQAPNVRAFSMATTMAIPLAVAAYGMWCFYKKETDERKKNENTEIIKDMNGWFERMLDEKVEEYKKQNKPGGSRNF